MKKLFITLVALCAMSMGAWAESSERGGSMNLEGILMWKMPADGGTMTIYNDDYRPMLNYSSADDNLRQFAGPEVESIDMQKGFNIGNYAFSQLENLESVTLHGSSATVFPIYCIGENAFAGSSKLASINSEILDDLRYIGANAFAGTAIKTFTIKKPMGRTLATYATSKEGFPFILDRAHCYIGANAFNSPYLSTVYMKDETPFSDTYNYFLNDYAYLVVDNAEVDSTYSAAWPEIADRIIYLQETVPFTNEEVKEICVNKWDTNDDGELSYEETFAVKDFGDAFAGDTTITKIDGLEPFVNVTVIGSGTFAGCTALESITTPPHITDIADDAFTGCTNLKEIHFVNKTPQMEDFTVKTNDRTHIIVPDDAVGAYDAWWTNKSELIIGESHIPFQCPVTKQICVTNWDTNKDGELSYAEAAAVTTQSFKTTFQSSSITSFDEFQYFTGVTFLYANAFDACTRLASIIIPSNVTTIPGYAFRWCQALTSIIIPSKVTRIETNAFQYCDKLNELIIEDSDNELTLYGTLCPNSPLKKIYIGRNISISTISYGLFSSNLEHVTIGKCVTKIPRNMCYQCWNIQSINIPANVTSIGANAFNGILTVIFNSSVYSSTEYNSYSDIAMFIVPDESVTAYRTAWPNEAYRITSKSALENWKEVICEAQPTSSHLAELIGEGKELDVVKLRIRGTINSYDMMVMRNKMQNLRELDLTNATIVANSFNYGTGVSQDNVFPDFMKGKPLTNILLPASITSIGNNALKGCNRIKEIAIPDNVTSIGNNAFDGCSALSAINMSGNSKLQTIGDNSFANTANLKNVDFSQALQLESIGGYAFQSSAITAISLPTSLKSIGSYAFKSCTGLLSFTSAANIGGYAFSGCTGLKTVTVQDESSTIGEYAFQNCTALTDVEIGEDVTRIGQYAFTACTALSSITIPDAVTSLGTYAFNGCTALEKAEIGMGITSVPQYLFKGCTALKEVKLSPKTTTIQSSAFQDCIGLTEFHLPPYLTTIQSNAFSNCNNLKEIYAYMPDVPIIAASTFSNYKTSTLYAPAFLFNAYYYDSGWNQFLNVLRCDLRPGDYEAFYTNKDLLFKEGEERITEDKPVVELGNQGAIIVEGANQEFTTVDMERDETSSSLIGDNNIPMEELRVKIAVSKQRWYFLCFPYDVVIDSCTYPGKYAWREYDGAARAKGGTGWKNVEGDTLSANKGYIFQSDTKGTLWVRFAEPTFGGDRPKALAVHSSSDAKDASWNFVGNPYTSYYNMQSEDFAAPITIWNGTSYVAYRPGDDDYHLQPFEAFFVQKPESASEISFDADRRETYRQSVATTSAQAKARMTKGINPERRIINICISDNDTAMTDRTRLVLNQKASRTYEMECDAAKFLSDDASVQIYMVEGTTQLSINERPEEGDMRLGYVAQQEGTFRLEAQRMDVPMAIHDAETGTTFDLSEGAYTFSTKKGTFNKRFTLRPATEATAILDITKETGVAIGMQDGGLSIGGAEGKNVSIYTIGGVLVAEQSGNGFVSLASGTYVVSVDGKSAKVNVK